MASRWQILQAEFLSMNVQTGIKAKDWCEARGLNYATARRHIKLTAAKPEDKARAMSSPKAKAIKAKKNQLSTGKDISKARYGNVSNFKHGGYAKYFKSDIGELIESANLHDELKLCRFRVHSVMHIIVSIHEQLATNPSLEVAASLYEKMFKADMALDKNIARIESITKTLSSNKLEKLRQDKIIANTELSLKRMKAAGVAAILAEFKTELAQLKIDKLVKMPPVSVNWNDSYELTSGNIELVVG